VSVMARAGGPTGPLASRGRRCWRGPSMRPLLGVAVVLHALLGRLIDAPRHRDPDHVGAMSTRSNQRTCRTLGRTRTLTTGLP
jgi:hypothetical protein